MWQSWLIAAFLFIFLFCYPVFIFLLLCLKVLQNNKLNINLNIFFNWYLCDSKRVIYLLQDSLTVTIYIVNSQMDQKTAWTVLLMAIEK